MPYLCQLMSPLVLQTLLLPVFCIRIIAPALTNFAAVAVIAIDLSGSCTRCCYDSENFKSVELFYRLGLCQIVIACAELSNRLIMVLQWSQCQPWSMLDAHVQAIIHATRHHMQHQGEIANCNERVGLACQTAITGRPVAICKTIMLGMYHFAQHS